MGKIGVSDTLDSRYLEQLVQLMKMDQFNGMLGGRDSQARYLLGIHE